MAKDYYDLLGVNKNATEQELKTAYRNQAKKYHPDKFSGQPDAEKKQAEDKFKEINHAYDVLSNPEKRSNYDQYGDENGASFNGGGGFGGFSGGGFGGGGFDDIINDIFSGFSGRGRNSADARVDGDDITLQLNLSFEEAAFGCEKEISFSRDEACKDCNGTGAESGSSFEKCSYCNGTGTLRQVTQTIFGAQTVSRPCPHCGGKGKRIINKCKTCKGLGYTRMTRTLKVTVPAGVDTNQMMTYYNEGNSGKNGGAKGNLIVIINVANHQLFKRKGYDLYLEVAITFAEAACGCKLEVPTLAENVCYSISEGTQTGTVFRLKGKGVKYLKKEAYGDLYVTVVVETPKGLNKKQKEMLSNFEETLSNSQNPKSKKFNS
ncbi:MAG: molecular chaperone DnaJ [Clostridia bacterium]